MLRNNYTKWLANLIGCGLFAVMNFAAAGEVSILMADFRSAGSNHWAVNVTLKHDDSGWDHYADNWRVVDVDGNVLGDRVLFHPHVDEQPFTRGINSVLVPEGVTTVYIEAHDKVHGWTEKRLKVDLKDAKNGHVRVKAQGMSQ
ncbi:hypothetical protein [Neptunomonas japonica]|uniref:hypothetical protein n=1 Tax=Neptunomonas japonica TaxID=417574 RepID=UPI000403D461|nr:hypothetical protein [Neptunomonas japonica]